MGVYELLVRTDGDSRLIGGKGWRLELMNTGHRGHIQIHRATPNLSIQGCILPVHFNTLLGSAIRKGDRVIQTKSLEIMLKIEARLGNLQNLNMSNGQPSLTIAETLPAAHITNRSHAYA